MKATAQHPMSTTPLPELPVAPAVELTDTLVLKEGSTFLVTLRDGTVPVGGSHPLGLYRDDCRHLAGHELSIAGELPRLLVASAPTGAEGVHELTNPDMTLEDGSALPLQTLQVRVERALTREGDLRERLYFHLFAREPVDLEVRLALAADFRPMFAIRGIVDLPPAPVSITPTGNGLRFAAVTSDGVERTTTVTADRRPTSTAGGVLTFDIHLDPGAHDDVRLSYALAAADVSRDSGPAAVVPDLDRTKLVVDDELTKRVVDRAAIDLRMLRSPLDDQSYFAAGVPWFATLFGRDSIITALELVGYVPQVAEQTLRVLADRLGQRVDPVHEEEPGKVLHELRSGEVAARDLTPLTRYYGTVDATPLWLCLMAEHADWAGDLSLFHDLRGAVEATLGWIEHYGDHDGDGLIDYRASTPDGLRNQGWKDSEDGVMDEHGVPLEPPIALVEVQAYAIRALRGIARLYEHDGDAERAAELRGQADARTAGLERFWVPSRGFYGMGIDGDGRTSAALASNQGHLLWAKVLPPDRARAVRDALMSVEMFSGWGLRTLGGREAAYNPVGYHLGTVWPHDTAMAAIGLRRYGFDADFLALFEGLLEAASNVEGYSLPELFAGFSRRQYERPVPYPVACHPQAWASGALPAMLVAALGLRADGLNGRLRVSRPTLPGWVNRMEVKDLAVAGSRVDLLFERTGAGDSVALTDARVAGDLEVVLEIRG